jgi:hypothetical protein
VVGLHGGVEAVRRTAPHAGELPGVVGQHVDPVVIGDDLGGHLADLVEHGEVGQVGGRGTPARPAHRLDGVPQPPRVAAQQDHLVTAVGQHDGGGQPDAGTAARHHHRAGHGVIRSPQCDDRRL